MHGDVAETFIQQTVDAEITSNLSSQYILWPVGSGASSGGNGVNGFYYKAFGIINLTNGLAPRSLLLSKLLLFWNNFS